MRREDTFCPDWASAPGETLSDMMESLGLGVEELAQKTGLGAEALRAVLRAEDPEPITEVVAEGLARAGGTRDFWLARERNYREDLPRVRAIWERRRWTVFVSGHLDLTEAEFREHYAEALSEASAAWQFVVGDARGADRMAQDFLRRINARVTVYHMLKAPRHNAGFPLVGGFESDEERDEAMTRESSRDIAWVRPGRERSGTARNLARRLGRPT